MMRKISLSLFLIASLAMVLYLKFYTFNPFSNYHEIQTIRKISYLAIKYAKKNNLNLNDLTNIDETLALTASEKSFLQSHAIDFDKSKDGDIIVNVSKGFDDLIVFNYTKNCWTATQTVVFLDKCQNR